MSNKYTSTSQQNLMTILSALGARPFEPCSAGDLATQCALPKDATFRALKNLEQQGWAEQLPSNGWRLTPALIRIAENMRLALHTLHHHYLGQEAGTS